MSTKKDKMRKRDKKTVKKVLYKDINSWIPNVPLLTNRSKENAVVRTSNSYGNVSPRIPSSELSRMKYNKKLLGRTQMVEKLSQSGGMII
jgi:hypothetical protein